MYEDVMSHGSVVVVGSAHQDLILSVSALPVAGETVVAADARYGFGGKGANQAIAATRGGANVRFVGMVGDDRAGELIEANLAAFGVDTRGVGHSSDQKSGLAVVAVDESGANLILVAPGAGSDVSISLVESALESVGSHDVVVLQCEIPPAVVEATLALASESPATVVLNLAPFTRLSADAVARADVIVVNEGEAAALAESLSVAGEIEELPLRLAAATMATVIITQGERGSVLGRPDGLMVNVPSVSVDAVVDTTGAGDVYVGTLAAALSRGEIVPDAMRRASAAAAASVATRGAQPHPVPPLAATP